MTLEWCSLAEWPLYPSCMAFGYGTLPITQLMKLGAAPPACCLVHAEHKARACSPPATQDGGLSCMYGKCCTYAIPLRENSHFISLAGCNGFDFCLQIKQGLVLLVCLLRTSLYGLDPTTSRYAAERMLWGSSGLRWACRWQCAKAGHVSYISALHSPVSQGIQECANSQKNDVLRSWPLKGCRYL